MLTPLRSCGAGCRLWACKPLKTELVPDWDRRVNGALAVTSQCPSAAFPTMFGHRRAPPWPARRQKSIPSGKKGDCVCLAVQARNNHDELHEPDRQYRT